VLFLQVIEIQLSSFIPYVSGPKRPQDRVAVSDMKVDFHSCLKEKVRVQPSLCIATRMFDVRSPDAVVHFVIHAVYQNLEISILT
jgi:aconitase A